VASIAVSGSSPAVGSTSQLTATATLSNGSTQAITTLATWQSSNAAVLTVSPSGVATALSAGDTDVTATYVGVKGSLHVSVAARTYGLMGVIADETTRGALADVRVEVLNGANAGKLATTDASGTYTFAGLVAETFRLRASKDGYAWGEQNVTVPDVPRADFFLHQYCNVSVSPTSYSGVNWPLINDPLTLTATPSTCSWGVSTTDDWIKLTPPTTGVGSSTFWFTPVPNTPVTASRTGSVLVSWPGGSARVAVEEQPATCTPSETVPVAASGAGYLFKLGVGCFVNTTMTIDVPWLQEHGTSGGLLYLNLMVQPNPGPQRTGHLTMDGHGNGLYAQYTFVQANP
jgi:hypothetical protein